MMSVAAAVIERDGRLLIARRRPEDRFGGVWEFPGGKVEAGESPSDGLRREIREEFDLEVAIGPALGTYPFASEALSLVLIAFRAVIVGGAVRLHDHSEIAWVLPSELAAYDFALPDRPLVRRLAEDVARG